jgi:transcriptional regulator with XRE-family HTH domain
MATDYGKRLKEARKSAGMTHARLSKLTGIPQSTISTAERMGNGSSDTVVYAKALGVDPAWLATGEGDIDGATKWPFKLFTLAEFLGLPEEDRRAVEDFAYGRIGRMRQRRAA